MSAVARSRHAARVVLHGVARPYFRYPPLEDSWWYLPEVIRWQPWEPTITVVGPAKKLIGKNIIPSLVNFPIPAGVYITHERLSPFRLHLRQRTGDRWDTTLDTLVDGYVRAERLDSTISFTEPDGMTTHTLALPGPTSHVMRQSLSGAVVRGLFRDGWSRREREDDAEPTGYPPEDGA